MRGQAELQIRIAAIDLAVKFNAGAAIKDTELISTAREIEAYLKGPQLKLV